jgi:hypothetical protein
MTYAKPDNRRYVYAYLPTVEDKKRWEDMAKKANIPLSRFVFEHVENSLKQEEDKDYVPRVELLKNIRELEEELSQIQQLKRRDDVYIERLEKEVRGYRTEPFLEGKKFSGKRTYDKDLIELFKSRGFVERGDVLKVLKIDPRDSDIVKAIFNQIESLQDWELLEATRTGWRWKR